MSDQIQRVPVTCPTTYDFGAATPPEWPQGEYVPKAVYDADLARVTAELAEARSERQREHDLRVTIAAALNELAALRKIVAAAARLRGINLTPADGDEKHG